MKENKYLYYDGENIDNNFIVDKVNEVLSKNERLCIIVINTVFKTDLSKINMIHFDRVSFGKRHDAYFSKITTNLNDKVVMNIFCNDDRYVMNGIDSVVGKEITHVIVVTDKPTKSMNLLFNHAKIRIRG